MSRLKTHLLNEDPTVILIGSGGIFRDKIAKSLQQKNIQIKIINLRDFLQKKIDLNFFNNAYKIIWIYEGNNKKSDYYLEALNKIKTLKSPLVIVTSLITGLDDSSGELFKEWKNNYNKQIQFIVDCNYHLPRASFIFGENIIISGAAETSLEFILDKIHKGILVDPNVRLSFLEVDNFVENLGKYLFSLRNRGSILIRGEGFSSKKITALLKKIYDSYHGTSVRMISETIELSKSVPFSVEEVVIKGSLSSVLTKIVKKLLPPQKKDLKDIEKPSQRPIVVRDESLIEKKTLIKPSILVEKEASVSILEADESVIVEEVDKKDVDDEIQRIFKSSRADFKVDRIDKIVKTTNKNTKKSKRKRILFIGGIGATGVATGVILLVLIFFTSHFIFRKELSLFISSGIANTDEFVEEDNNLKNITNFVSLQVESYDSLIDSSLIDQVSLMVRISNGVQSIPQILSEVSESSKNLFLQIIDGDINKTSDLSQILGDKAELAYEKLSAIQASLDRVDLSIKSDERESLVSEYGTKLKEIRSGMIISQQLNRILSSLSGEKSKKTYAIIFQNNQELRPTGGFIQAVALLNFDGGVLVSRKVYSVYDLDRKLPGEISPPDDLTKYLGEDRWYLRDSNWDPDFPTTSKQIGWFLNKSLGIDIDGVIALNLFVVKDILEATGPIELSEYNEVINHKNILERMEFHSEVVLVNSPDSMDYSVLIFEELINKIVGVGREKIPGLLSSFANSLEEKQMMISVFEGDSQFVFNNLGWTGSLAKPQCPAQLSIVDCKVDVFTQVEANVGINKANYYLDREISHKIKIERNEALHDRKIVFKNNAKSNSWPKGTYKSYQRFYIDKKANLSQILIDGVALSEDQISKKESNGFMEIGIRVSVPIQKQAVVEIKYSSPHEFVGGFSYVFFNQRQPGTSGDFSRVSFEYSDEMKPVLIAPSAKVYDNIIDFETNSERSLFGVEFE